MYQHICIGRIIILIFTLFGVFKSILGSDILGLDDFLLLNKTVTAVCALLLSFFSDRTATWTRVVVFYQSTFDLFA